MSMFTISGAPTIEEGDMELIFSTTLTGSASSMTTGTLPTGYKSLVIETSLRCDVSALSAVVLGFFNGDQTKTNYQTNFLTYQSTGLGSTATLNYPYVAGTTGATAAASFFAMDRIVIVDHESTAKYKSWQTVEAISVGTAAASRFGLVMAGQWINTDAITSITFEVDAAGPPSFVAGSSMAVYGLK